MTKAMANKAAEKSQNNWSMKVMMTIAFIVMALTFSFTAMAGSRKVQPGRYYKDEETAMVAQLNDIRRKAGLGSLRVDKNLSKAARIRAKECSALFEHERPDGSKWYTVSRKAMAENLALEYDRAAGIAMNQLMGSMRHRHNILGKNYKSIGIGCYTTEAGETYWAQEFGF